MKKTLITMLLAVMALVTAMAQTMNVQIGQVIYQIPAAQAGDMVYQDGTTLTIMDKTYQLSELTQIFFDDTAVADSTVSVVYNDETAQVFVAGNAARYLTVSVNGAHVSIAQSNDLASELTYILSGSSTDGEFYLSGSFKATVEFNGLTLTNPSGAPINIQNGKRIAVSIKKDTQNTLTDGTGHSLKGCFISKGHTEFKGKGILNVYGNSTNAIWSKEYVEMKNCTINVLSSVKDGLNCNQYFLMESGTLTMTNVGDDGLQVSFDDSTNRDPEDTGSLSVLNGTIDITVKADGAKGIKADSLVNIQGGNITITQTGNIVADTDLSYPTSIKAGADINITGGTVIINNTAAGGKGLSADGNININENNATTVLNITANGTGGTAETTGESTEPEVTASYKVYVSLPTTGGGGPGGGGSNVWRTVYLYKNDGTLVQTLTSTVTKSSGYSSATFYYYDFMTAGDGSTYYFKSDNYNSRGTTYTIKSTTFTAPTSGEDVYYSITNSYTTSGTTRTYSLSNVTNTYSGSSDVSEDNGTAYNAGGIKADGDLTIGGGTITVKNSGSMSKSIKSKGTVTINGGNITLTPSGAMKVINNDASYSSGIKTKYFVQNDGTLKITASGAAGRGITATDITTNGGTLTITNSGAGQTGTNDNYTAKGLKADSKIALNAGTISITMSGTGGKGIKSSGTYTQGTSDGNGPTLTVNTSGSSLGGTSGGGGGFPGGGAPGGQSSGGSSAKAIKVQGTVYVYGGTTEVSTKTDGAEGLESKTAIYFEGGKHYFACYDDCINSSGCIYFNGGVTVCYSNGNDAIDSNAGRTGAITIGNGNVFAYTTKGSPEEGFDCDNNSYIQITGTGISISAGGSQGGGWGGSTGNTISNAKQGYAFVTSTLSYTSGRYYTLSDASGNNLVTYSFPASVSSNLALFTATGMVKGSTYYVKYSTTAPTNATTAWHGLYLGSTATGSTQLTSFTAQ